MDFVKTRHEARCQTAERDQLGKSSYISRLDEIGALLSLGIMRAEARKKAISSRESSAGLCSPVPPVSGPETHP